MNHPINEQIDLIQEAESLTTLKRKSSAGRAEEYAGPCPVCGGHDRFVVQAQRWLCRHCTEGKWKSPIDLIMMTRNLPFKDACRMIEGEKPMTPAERERIATERAERAARELEESIKRANEALEALRKAQSWTRYHAQLECDDSARDIWRKRGIPDVYQDIFNFGYDPRHVYYSDDNQHVSASLTIPVFAMGGECVNVRHRLLSPSNPSDKYRPERAGLPASAWFADPSLSHPKSLLVVEGEIKAAVSYIAADDPTMQVAGMPGKSNGVETIAGYLDTVDGPVYILPDPDAVDLARADCDFVGRERARLVLLPDKIDDMINRNSLGKDWMQMVLRQARRM